MPPWPISDWRQASTRELAATAGTKAFGSALKGPLKTVTLTGNDTSIDEMVTDLQNGINAASAFGSAVITVGKNAAGNALELTSSTSGLSTSISINSAINTVSPGVDTTMTTPGATVLMAEL